MSREKLLLTLPLALDGQALSALIVQKSQLQVVTETDLPRTVTTCSHLRPEYVLIGLGFNRELTLETVVSLSRAAADPVVAFLDNTFAVGRAGELSSIPNTCYFTRRQPIDEILAHLRAALAFRQLGGKLQNPTDAFFREILRKRDRHNVLELSERERTVLRELAIGKTVVEIAASLRLAHSTVDNHKSRLMRKLRVHKASTLIHVALRTGMLWATVDDAEDQPHRPKPMHTH